MNLSDLLSRGELLHPVDREIPNSVDLFRAIALASGDLAILDEPGMTDHVVPLARSIGGTRNLVVVLADGLGIEPIERHASPSGTLRTKLRRELRAVYPSTTAVALTSAAAAAWPGQHGLTGWFTRFPSLERTLAILPFVEQATGVPGGSFGIDAADLIQVDAVWGRSLREVHAILPRDIEPGTYNEWFELGVRSSRRRSQERAPREVERLLRRARGPALVYAYLPVVDSVAHKYGPWSEETGAAVRSIENALDEIVARAREATGGDVTVLLTADHGHTETPKDYSLVVEAGDSILEILAAPPSGDVRSIQLQRNNSGGNNGSANAWMEQVREYLNGRIEAMPQPRPRFSLVSSDELFELGLLGPVPVPDSVRANWGDATLIALDGLTLEYATPEARPKQYPGSHSGLTPAEMRVPLVLV